MGIYPPPKTQAPAQRQPILYFICRIWIYKAELLYFHSEFAVRLCRFVLATFYMVFYSLRIVFAACPVIICMLTTLNLNRQK
jgi:hypothetical protein